MISPEGVRVSLPVMRTSLTPLEGRAPPTLKVVSRQTAEPPAKSKLFHRSWNALSDLHRVVSIEDRDTQSSESLNAENIEEATEYSEEAENEIDFETVGDTVVSGEDFIEEIPEEGDFWHPHKRDIPFSLNTVRVAEDGFSEDEKAEEAVKNGFPHSKIEEPGMFSNLDKAVVYLNELIELDDKTNDLEKSLKLQNLVVLRERNAYFAKLIAIQKLCIEYAEHGGGDSSRATAKLLEIMPSILYS